MVVYGELKVHMDPILVHDEVVYDVEDRIYVYVVGERSRQMWAWLQILEHCLGFCGNKHLHHTHQHLKKKVKSLVQILSIWL